MLVLLLSRYLTGEHEKIANLKLLLQRIFRENDRIIVFVETKRSNTKFQYGKVAKLQNCTIGELLICACGKFVHACVRFVFPPFVDADFITKALRLDGMPALCIHGDKKQDERRWVLNDFKTGKSPILIATDVASRGLDIKNVKYVINFDFPNQIEDYVHRIGRTGRAGAHGASFTFLTSDKYRLAKDLVKILRESEQPVPPQLEKISFTVASNPGRNAYYRSGRSAYNVNNIPVKGGNRYY
ncbi:ATP-dependent RNA helicase DDX5, putative (DDX5) [Plasmodium ovale wallikeri]|uniref:RNA helicase n=1 Tax=Plasmodium ovale wallikeri TaxID=864142 RepID=A0A1A8ZI79_PLAOA|nr:ATP-dependent RNA helicase DDX5, putative (DDX5) [Plasmodium ovale wallikeri]SBT43740.1 ATP-dependent RNA helicase DDX5, putative (DDX5) [Plasmodium ovale wallikeri]